MIFDTHSHYDDAAFDEDREELLESLPAQGISNVVNVGASLLSCRQTLELIRQYDFMYAAVGVHPSETAELDEESFAWLTQTVKEKKVVAVGEIGLDYYWKEPEQEVQKKWFARQLGLAREAGLPVIIHSRDAAQDTYDIMREQRADEIGGVVHCYSYSLEMAKKFEELGFYFGIGGMLTFHNAKRLKEVVEYLPLERLVLETDCPYLSPAPNRGKRNSSLNLKYVAGKIAEIKNISYDRVIEETERNARKLYRL